MEEEINTLKYGKLSLTVKDNEITFISIDNVEVQAYIKENTPLINISYNIYFPHTHKVTVLEEYVEFYFDYLEGISLLQKENPHLGAMLSSYIYQIMTIYWQDLLTNGKHIQGILFWKHILKLTLYWEHKDKNHIHKGSLYGYIAFTYLAMGDSYAGFSFLNCALEDDIYIGKLCKELNYPEDAPCNLTISLNSSINNFMQPFVENVKKYLQSFMGLYKESYPKFDVNEFDRIFLENKEFVHLKIYFVFCIWAICDNINKYEFIFTPNSFNKQSNLLSLFNISLILDNVLEYYQTKNSEKFKNSIVMYGDRVKKYVETSKMNSNYYMLTKSKLENEDLDVSLPELLKDEQDIKKREANFLLTSLLLRNFVAHKMKPQDVSITHHDRIIATQIYSLIMILKYYNP